MSAGGGMFLAWIVVGLAGLATLAGVFVLSRWIPIAWLRSLLRCLVAVWLLLPAKIQVVAGYYAPAYIVLIFEGLFRRDGDPGPALTVLTSGTLVVIALFLGVAGVRARRRRTTDEAEIEGPDEGATGAASP